MEHLTLCAPVKSAQIPIDPTSRAPMSSAPILYPKIRLILSLNQYFKR
jgi:hypothetical protein